MNVIKLNMNMIKLYLNSTQIVSFSINSLQINLNIKEEFSSKSLTQK